MAFFGVNFILQKFCPCKKNDKYQVWVLVHVNTWAIPSMCYTFNVSMKSTKYSLIRATSKLSIVLQSGQVFISVLFCAYTLPDLMQCDCVSSTFQSTKPRPSLIHVGLMGCSEIINNSQDCSSLFTKVAACYIWHIIT